MKTDFIKVMVVYQANPTKRNQTENDMLMRETWVRASDILEITPTIPDDEAVLAKAYIRTISNPAPLSVMETADEIMEMITKALETV